MTALKGEPSLMCAQNQETATQNAGFRPETADFAVILVYPSWTMKYALTTLANLLTLVVGITIGLLLAPHIEKSVHATSAEPQAATPGTTFSGAITQQSAEPKVTTVQPSMTTGTIGIYLILSHHIQSDELVVNGYDVMKLQNAELSLLSRFVPASEIQAAVDGAKAGEVFTVAKPQPPAQPTAPPR